MTTAATVTAAPSPASDRDVPLPLRGDTFLGVCEAVGQDLGINPNWLRATFAALLLWNPEVVVIAYLALGIVVAATRFFLPDRQGSQGAETQAASAGAGDDVTEEERLAA